MKEQLKDLQKPFWLRKRIKYSNETHEVKSILSSLGLNTVCKSARCPNLSECYRHKRATFMILGNRCTRNCTFCSVVKAEPGENIPLYEDEPDRVCKAVRALGLKYVVITSVTRDDLEDGGALQFAKTILKIREYDRSIRIEVLTPDFMGKRGAIDRVAKMAPDIFNHNVETVPRLYKKVRPGADYLRSLRFLRYIKEGYPEIFLKSGFMVGLGEKKNEVLALLEDLRGAGCDAVTIGQYLRPSKWNIPVSEYIKPDIFKWYENQAKKIGFLWVASGPYVRSSYMAHEGYERMIERGSRNTSKNMNQVLT